MKTINRILIPAAALFCMASCDVLDKAPDGRITMEDVYSDPDKVAAALNSCYNNIHRKNITYYWATNLPTAMSDDAWSSDDGEGNVLVNEMYAGKYRNLTVSSGHGLASWYQTNAPSGGSYWDVYFTQIRLCTEFLENIGTANVSETDRMRYTAEAHILRAFFYMELIKWYGKLPIIRETIGNDYDYSEMKRSPVAEVAAFINEDCDIALSIGQLPWRISLQSEQPRVTKALAWALKAKSWLFAASPLHNEGQYLWDKAFEVNRDAVDALRKEGYELYTTCSDPVLFGNGPAAAYYELAVTGADWSGTARDKETIWQVKDDLGWNNYNLNYVGNETNMSKVDNCPTQELVDAYEIFDGTNAYPLLDLRQPYNDDFHLQPNYNPAALSIYDEQDPYKNRDPRFYVSVLYNGATFYWDNMVKELETYVGGKHGISFVPSDRNKTRTGYIHNKMIPPARNFGVFAPENSPWKYYRLGELLLDLAECAAEAGNDAAAREALNEVRARVGMPPVTSSGDDLKLRIRNERRIEMMWEETRFFDLRRWQTPRGDLSETCRYFTAMYITMDGIGNLHYERRNISTTPRGGWENQNLLMPLQDAEAALMEARTGERWQNPGW